jgi:hypothetical protein
MNDGMPHGSRAQPQPQRLQASAETKACRRGGAYGPSTAESLIPCLNLNLQGVSDGAAGPSCSSDHQKPSSISGTVEAATLQQEQEQQQHQGQREEGVNMSLELTLSFAYM